MNAALPATSGPRVSPPAAAEARAVEVLALSSIAGLGDAGVARVWKQARRNGGELQDFYDADLDRLQRHYGLSRAAATAVRAEGDRLRAKAAELLARTRRSGIVLLVPGDRSYPAWLEAIYDGEPPVLHARGDLALLQTRTVAFLSSSGTSTAALTHALGLASRCAEAGLTLVTGAQNPTYNLVALAGKRAGGKSVVVLHEGLLTATGEAPEREPVPLARRAEVAFDPGRTLLLSPFRLEGRWQKGNGPRRDKLVVALAGTVVALEVRPAGVVDTLCREALARRQRLFVCQPSEAVGSALANDALLALGASPLVPDAAGSNCDLVLRPEEAPARPSGLGGSDLERRRALGQFFTPPSVAGFMWDMLELIHGGRLEPGLRVIDPACGDGVILRAARERGGLPGRSLWGVDIDETLMPLWRQDAQLREARLFRTNGLVDHANLGIGEGAFDVVAGNPPFSGQGLRDLLKLAAPAATARAQTLDLFGEPSGVRELAPPSPAVPAHERAVLDALARTLSRYACWRLGADVEDDDAPPIEADLTPDDLFAGMPLTHERRVVAGDYERIAQLVAQWPPDRLLDPARPEVRDLLRRLASTAIEVFFMERFLRLAKPGGLIAVIVPEGILASDRNGPLRRWLSGELDLLAVVSLPHKVFTGVGANAKTSIVFARRRREPRPVVGGEDPDSNDTADDRAPVFLLSPRLDAPGWNLEWYLDEVLKTARAKRKALQRTCE